MKGDMRFAFGLCRVWSFYTFGRCTVFFPSLSIAFFGSGDSPPATGSVLPVRGWCFGRFDVQTSDYTVRNQRNGKKAISLMTPAVFTGSPAASSRNREVRRCQILFSLLTFSRNLRRPVSAPRCPDPRPCGNNITLTFSPSSRLMSSPQRCFHPAGSPSYRMVRFFVYWLDESYLIGGKSRTTAGHHVRDARLVEESTSMYPSTRKHSSFDDTACLAWYVP